jgi:hypothetical protein
MMRIGLMLLLVLVPASSAAQDTSTSRPPSEEEASNETVAKPTDFELTMDSFAVYEKGPLIKISVSGWAKEGGEKKYDTFVYEVDLETHMVSKNGIPYTVDSQQIEEMERLIIWLQRKASESVVAWHVGDKKLTKSVAQKKSP